MFICKYCGKECKNDNSLRNHERMCKLNPNRNINYLRHDGHKGYKGVNQYIKAKELGLDKPTISKETREKIAKAWKGKKHSQEEKNKISIGIRKAIKEHPESYSSSNVNGRVQHYNYNGYKIDGLWELEVAKYLDSKNIKWEKPNKGFEYEWNNSIHLYFPDFYLPEYDYYIEVKGYQRERDLYKWKSVDKLIIIKAKEITQIRNNEFVLGL